jgi:hypothetical protein
MKPVQYSSRVGSPAKFEGKKSIGGDTAYLYLSFEPVRYAARRIGTDINTPIRPVPTRFLLNYEAKRWSKANFFYINEIAIFDIIEPSQAVKISEI